ncbi:hypothetical protein PPYR_05633 [Photinus pyralis]|uniref:Uncharacterized protein n=1 Tax=Photinus pyralis TaxID=7054 RepID=A0A5N4AVC4_PHOPY|nr:zinc finger MYM-type protein 3-like [Photinus pyralis]KAB0801279.1 hypothetical protein PPYR_05633 [Photinus pyralis]
MDGEKPAVMWLHHIGGSHGRAATILERFIDATTDVPRLHSLEGYSSYELSDHLANFIRVQSLLKEYSPDSLYYFCLGIQWYLHACGRVGNIFFHDTFMDCRKLLNQFALKFIGSYYDDPIYISTCVSEKYLWESDHLSPKWPHTLLWTVVYLVMKYFKLSTVEEHKALKMKNLFKRETRDRVKGKQSYFFYFLQESRGTQYCKRQLLPDKNPSRCPVEIMKIYLSKCPRLPKMRDSCLYLKPISRCDLESQPYWFTQEELPDKDLAEMLNRFKMVSEITELFVKDRITSLIPWY